MAAILLSDLHLPVADSPYRRTFLEFLQGPARQARQLYLLGDLFEVWLGDDIGLADYAQEVAALRAVADAGVQLAVMRGNRDFLLGRNFFAACGAEDLPDPVVRQLPDMLTALSHGDQWCSDDLAYQRWRRFAHNRYAQASWRKLPRAWREAAARRIRGHSAAGKRQKSEQIMDVNPQAIRSAFGVLGVARIIHGHTHRPGTHDYEIGGLQHQRIVLPDWRPEQMAYLMIDADGVTHHTL